MEVSFLARAFERMMFLISLLRPTVSDVQSLHLRCENCFLLLSDAHIFSTQLLLRPLRVASILKEVSCQEREFEVMKTLFEW